MNWLEAHLTLQLLVEERIGAPMRAQRDTARAREDASFAVLRAKVNGPR